MTDTKKILDSIKNKIQFEPIDDRVLIKPLKQKTVKKAFKVPVNTANTADAAEQQVTETTEEIREVPTNCQLGVVLKIGKAGASPIPFEEGDIIVYPTNAGVKFELFKDSILLKRYEILGRWIEPTSK
jgi:co-chaperonin GroES (HSP10)